MDACLISHTGLGDCLFMIGAIHYIKKFYKNIYYICKKRYSHNVKLFFENNSNIHIISYNDLYKIDGMKKKVNPILRNKNIDILVSGSDTKRYFKNRITNKLFLKHSAINKNYNIDLDTVNKKNYSFIESFYKDIGLNLTQFFENFSLPNVSKSKELYESISDYYIIFIQLKSSTGVNLNIKNLKEKYLDHDNVLLVCNDSNLYNKETHPIKYNLVKPFVLNEIINYTTTIMNANEIYIIDSCFTGIILPLFKTNRLKAKRVRIIMRNLVDKYKL